jgi:pyruvate carboxylase
MNGQARRITIKDENIKTNANVKPKADKTNPNHILNGAWIVVSIFMASVINSGWFTLTSSPTETLTSVTLPGKKVTVGNGDAIATGDLLIEIEKSE